MKIAYLGDDFLGVETGNNREVEAALRDLPSVRWNGAEHRWEVHISHLPDLMGYYRLTPDKIPAKLMERFEGDWLSCDVRMEVGHSRVRILGSGVPTRLIDELASFDVQDRSDSLEFLSGQWDGKRRLYDRQNFVFPTGLLEDVAELLKERKLRFQIIDQRPKPEPLSELPKALAMPLEEEDLRLLDAYAKQRRMVAVRGRYAGEEDLIRALVAVSSTPKCMVLAPNEFHAREIAAILEPFEAKFLADIPDLDAPVVVVPVDLAAQLFVGLDLGGARLSGKEKRLGMMLALRVRREKSVLAFRSDIANADHLHLIAMAAGEALNRIVLTRLVPRPDGMDSLLKAAFGQPQVFIAPAEEVRVGRLCPVQIRRLRAGEYPGVERDRPTEEVMRNGVIENASRMDVIRDAHNAALDAGLGTLILCETVEYAQKLSELGVPVLGAQAAMRALRSQSAPFEKGRDLPQCIIVADATVDPSNLLRIYLLMGERIAAAAGGKKKGAKSVPPLTVFDFDDPIPIYRRRHERRWAHYGLYPGWLAEASGNTRRAGTSSRTGTAAARRKSGSK